ncbi:hypothetical protein BUL40_02675 [Croceivirga radicis]|uniref:Thioester reductase (TE) domain-containing protein n=1 Tax=Croceivirga radicis TaxID=1929488 RepID=A0A1V6LWB3_9FLAO|nr:SDR family oxidoreductase [Croceivirga radicis]OQD44474.1 hypothetical protein BUL40_02675 [Croceivirga radicis]
MHIILTGATGTLGSQLLFRLLEERFNELNCIWLLVRNKKSVNAAERIQNMLTSAMAPKFVAQNLQAIQDKLRIIEASEALQPEYYLDLNQRYYMVHSAGFVNLSVNPKDETQIFEENLSFTKQLFNAFKPYLKKFVYISTAFAAGKQDGVIGNDYLNNTNAEYRNYYEASKHAAEKYVAQQCGESGIEIQILRPSVLGGNALEKPRFFISKYMVFYLFAKFFQHKTEQGSVRIQAGNDSNLNIIPTDYAAKVICKVLDQPVEQLNIVNPIGTHILTGISKILEAVNFKNYQLTQEIVDSVGGFETTLEKFYYETIGVHLTPYLTGKPQKWDTQLLESILPLPNYNPEEYLKANIEYAIDQKFRNQRW